MTHEDFEKYNITSPKHPQRIERDKAYDEKLRMMCIASLQNEGIEPDTTLETIELKKMLEDVMKKKAEETNVTVNAVTGESVEIESVENGDNPEDIIQTTEELEKIIDTVESSEEVAEFDKFQDEVADELSEYTEENTSNIEVVNEDEITVYVDMYKCMYVEDNGKYTYVDENLETIEKDIEESTILQLLSTGSVEKKVIKK